MANRLPNTGDVKKLWNTTKVAKMTTEHIVYVDSVGGATVLSCEALDFKNIDMIYNKLNPDTVKDTILHFRPNLDVKGLDIKVVDRR